MSIIQPQRQTLFVTNISKQNIVLTDIPSVPSIKPNQRIDLLLYTQPDQLSKSIILRGYVSKGWLVSEEYLHTHDDKSDIIHKHEEYLTNVNAETTYATKEELNNIEVTVDQVDLSAYALNDDLTAHINNTTNIHGIDTAALTELLENGGGTIDPVVLDSKADKVSDAIDGNFAALDIDGNLTDSGKNSSDFATVDHTHDLVAHAEVADSAGKLTTAVTINGVTFDGSTNITVPATGGVPETRTVNSHPLTADVVVTKTDVGLGNVDNTADSGKSVLYAATSGSTAQLTTSRNINGVAFNGTANITVYDPTKVPLTVQTDRKEPTGFINRTDSTITLTTRTVVVAPSSTSFSYYLNGTLITKTAAEAASCTTTIETTLGIYYIYFDINGQLQHSQIPWKFNEDKVSVATVYWDGATGLLGEERHGIVMDWATHEYLHHSVGTRYESGFGATLTNPAAISLDAGIFYDEDIEHDISSPSYTIPITTCKVFYRVTSPQLHYTSTASQNAYYHTVSSILQYDNSGTIADVQNNRYVAYWIFATSDKTNPIYVLMGQREDITLPNARLNNIYENISFGTLPFSEMKLLYRVILQRNGTATPNYIETQDYRSASTNLQGTVYTATSHGTLTGLTIDDHPQYAKISGRDGDIFKIDHIDEFTSAHGITFDKIITASGGITDSTISSTYVPYSVNGRLTGNANLAFDGDKLGIGSSPFVTDGYASRLCISNLVNEDFHAIILKAGLTAQQRNYIKWVDHNNIQKWLIGVNANNLFIWYDTSVNSHRIQLIPGSVSYIDSSGTDAVIINGCQEAGSGTGGLQVKSGGATPTTWFQVGASSIISCLLQTTIKPDGTNPTIDFQSLSTQIVNKPLRFISGGMCLRREAKAVSYTAVAGASMLIGVTDTTAVRTISLPSTGGINTGQLLIVKDESGGAGTNNIIIDGSASQTIDGDTTYSLNTNYGSLMFYGVESVGWFPITPNFSKPIKLGSTLDVSGLTTCTGGITDSTLINNNAVVYNVNGRLTSNPNLTFDGTTLTTNYFVINKTAENGVREKLLEMKVSDAANVYFALGNATISDGNFTPLFIGSTETSSVNAIQFIAQNYQDGSTTTPVMLFRARKFDGSADYLNASYSDLSNQMLFGWENNGTRVMQIAATGYTNIATRLGIGSLTAPTSTLDINGTFSLSPTTSDTNLITNGDFSVGSDGFDGWTESAGWTVVAGKATHSSGTTTLLQSITLVANQMYAVSVNAVCSGQYCFIKMGTNTIGTIETTKAYTFYYWATASGAANLTFTPHTDFAGSVDDISFKAYTGNLTTLGAVGIGTITPLSMLHVEAPTSGNYNGTSGSSKNNALVYFKNTTAWSTNEPWTLYVDGYTCLGGLRINGAGGLRCLHQVSSTVPLGFSCQGAQRITFTQSSDVEKMRIETTGYIQMPTRLAIGYAIGTDPTVTLDVSGTASISGLTTCSGGITDSTILNTYIPYSINGRLTGNANLTFGSDTLTVNTLSLASGSITDSGVGNAISFGSNNLSTSGTAAFSSININGGATTGLTISNLGTANYGIDMTSSNLSGTSDYFVYMNSNNFHRADGLLRGGAGFHIGEGTWSEDKLLYCYKYWSNDADAYGMYGYRYATGIGGATKQLIGIFGRAESYALGQPTRTWGWNIGIMGQGSGTNSADTGNVTNSCALYAKECGTGRPKVDNQYMLYIEEPIQGSSSKYSIYSVGGANYLGGTISITGLTTATGGISLSTTSGVNYVGQIIQNSKRVFHTYGTENLFIGEDSGNFDLTTASGNVCVGKGSGISLTTGYNNFFLGTDAGRYITEGNSNTVIGSQALTTCTIRAGILAIGYASCAALTTGQNLVAIGNNSMRYGLNPRYSVGVGSDVLRNLSASYVTAVGHQSGYSLDTGARGIFLGAFSGYRQTSLTDLFIVDRGLLDGTARANSDDEKNNSILYGVMADLPSDQILRFNAETTVSQSLYVSKFINILTTAATAGVSTAGVINQNSKRAFHTYGTQNLFIGEESGNFNTTGDGMNVGLGYQTLYNLTSGYANMCIGRQAGFAIKTGHSNILIGRNAGLSLSTNVSDVAGNGNVGLGAFSLATCITGSANVAIGYSSLNKILGNNNIGIGSYAGTAATGDNSVYIGYLAGGKITTGTGNIFIGYASGYRQDAIPTSNILLIGNQDYTTSAAELTNSIIYGVMAALPSNQTLRLNAITTVSQTLTVTGNIYISDLTTSIYKDINNNLVLNDINTGAITLAELSGSFGNLIDELKRYSILMGV